MSLIFLRHPKPDAPDGLCYGRTDLSLTAGLEATADHLNDTLPPFAQIVSSPLSRCFKLAQVIANKRQTRISVDGDLIEMDFGSWENTSWNAIPRQDLDAWAEDFFHGRPHGGESVAMLQSRVKSALANRGNIPTLWVSHAGVFRALMAETDHPDPWNARIDFAHFQTIDIP